MLEPQRSQSSAVGALKRGVFYVRVQAPVYQRMFGCVEGLEPSHLTGTNPISKYPGAIQWHLPGRWHWTFTG